MCLPKWHWESSRTQKKPFFLYQWRRPLGPGLPRMGGITAPRARLQMGFQDGAGTSWDLPLVRALGGEVHLRLSHTVCLRLGRGAQRCPGWGGALGPGTGGLDGPFFPRPQPSPGVRSLVGSKGPSSPLQSPCRASRPGGSQGPLLPRELLCGLGGTTCEGGFPLPSPVLTRGREWAWFGLGPGPRQDPTSHLRALRVPLLPGDFGPVPAQAVGVPELSLV